MNIRKYASLIAGIAVVLGMAVAVPAFAQTTPPMHSPNGGWQGERGMGMGAGAPGAMRPGVFGTVASVSGTTLTINARQGFGTSTPTKVFTIDASSAVVKKNNATSTIADIAVGDTVMVQGTVTGTNVVATMIRDGVPTMRPGMTPNGKGPAGKPGWSSTSTPAFSGNGEPVVAGTVSAVNGSTITITNKSNVTYTVDASSAKILAGQATSSISNIKTGDTVLVQGTVNANSVTASTVIDQGTGPANANGSNNKPAPKGIFGGIEQFFSHLFGF